MDRLLRAAKILALLAVVYACITLGNLARSGTSAVGHTVTVVDDADKAVKRADLAIKESQYLILQAGLTMDQARKASIKEVAILDAVNQNLESTLSNVNQFVVSSREGEATLLDTANKTLQGVQPVLVETQGAVSSLTVALGHVDVLVTNPDITKTLTNVQDASRSTATTMSEVSGTAADVHQAVHSYLHPTWAAKTADWLLKIAHAINPL